MSRVTYFVLASVAAHLVLLGGLNALVSGTAPTPPRIVEVSALMQPPPPPAEPEPISEPPPEVDEPEEPQAPACPTPRPARRPAPVRRETPVEPQPPTPSPEPLEPEEPEPEDIASLAPPTADAPDVGVPGSTAASPALAATPRSGGNEGSGNGPSGSDGRTAAEPDPCEHVAAALRSRIEAIKTYPRWAQAMNITGTVRLTMRIGQDGRPRGVRVVGSSGHSRLDHHATDTARRVGGLPSGCRRPVSIPIRFDVVRSRRR